VYTDPKASESTKKTAGALIKVLGAVPFEVNFGTKAPLEFDPRFTALMPNESAERTQPFTDDTISVVVCAHP
jgi:hypothetical protein